MCLFYPSLRLSRLFFSVACLSFLLILLSTPFFFLTHLSISVPLSVLVFSSLSNKQLLILLVSIFHLFELFVSICVFFELFVIRTFIHLLYALFCLLPAAIPSSITSSAMSEEFIWGNYEDDGSIIIGPVPSSLGERSIARAEKNAQERREKENARDPTSVHGWSNIKGDFPALPNRRKSSTLLFVDVPMFKWREGHSQSLKDESFPSLPPSKRKAKKTNAAINEGPSMAKRLQETQNLRQPLQTKAQVSETQVSENFPLLELSHSTSSSRNKLKKGRKKTIPTVRQVTNTFSASSKIEKNDGCYVKAKQ